MNRKILKTLLTLLIVITVFTFSRIISRSSRGSALKSREIFKKSLVECEAHSCLITNLYVINKSFHLFLDNPTEYNETVVFSGIGQGSFIFVFWDKKVFPENDRHIPVFLHSIEQGSNLNLQYYKTPIVLFSVLWDNLFRTLYAGISLF
jgi:hypothetical protein